jgi:hypothetical protein
MRSIIYKTAFTRSVIKALLLLNLLVFGASAKADLIIAESSSLALTANAQAIFSPNNTDTASESQGLTINPLTVAVSAQSIYNGYNEDLKATANGSATWTSASVGTVTFTNVGWSDTVGDGNVNLDTNTGWIYTFRSNVTGSFVINYDVTAHGTSSTTTNPLFGLNGFYLYEGAGLAPPQNATFQTGLNTSGAVSLAITSGQTYTVQIQNFANLSGGIGDTENSMDGTFDFDVQATGGQTLAVPAPSSLNVAIFSILAVAIIKLNPWRSRPPAPSLP